MSEGEEVLTIGGAAGWLGVQPAVVRNGIGLVPEVFQPPGGGSTEGYARRAELEAWLESQRIRRAARRSRPTSARPGEKLITIREAAARLGVCPATVWRWLDVAGLPYVELRAAGSARRVRHVWEEDVERLDVERSSGRDPGIS